MSNLLQGERCPQNVIMAVTSSNMSSSSVMPNSRTGLERSRTTKIYNKKSVNTLNFNHSPQIFAKQSSGIDTVEASFSGLHMPGNGIGANLNPEMCLPTDFEIKNSYSYKIVKIPAHADPMQRFLQEPLDTSLPSPQSTENRMSVNVVGLPNKDAKTIHAVPQMLQAIPCSMMPNTMSSHALPVVSSSQFVMTPPIIIRNSTSLPIVNALHLSTNPSPTCINLIQQHINVSYTTNNIIYTNAMPPNQQQHYVNLNSSAPIIVLPAVPLLVTDRNGDIVSKASTSTTPSMSSLPPPPPYPGTPLNNLDVKGGDFGSEAPPSTIPLLSTVTRSPYPGALLSNCGMEVSMASDPPPSTVPVMPMSSVSCLPYPDASLRSRDVKVEPTLGLTLVDTTSDEAQTQITDSSNSLDVSALSLSIKEEIDYSQPEELTVEVDPSNFFDTNSPEFFPAPEPYQHHPQEFKQGSFCSDSMTCYSPYYLKTTSPSQIQIGSVGKSEAKNIWNQRHKRPLTVSEVSEHFFDSVDNNCTRAAQYKHLYIPPVMSKQNFFPDRSKTANISSSQISSNAKSDANNILIWPNDKPAPVMNVSKTYSAVNRGSMRGEHYQYHKLQHKNSTLRKILPLGKSKIASLTATKNSSDGKSMSSPVQDLVSNKTSKLHVFKQLRNLDKDLPTTYVFAEQRPMQNSNTVMMQSPFVTAIQLPGQKQLYRVLRMSTRQLDANSSEHPKHETSRILGYGMVVSSSTETCEAETRCPKERIATSLNFHKLNHEEHNYSRRPSQQYIDKVQNSSITPPQLLQRTCRVVLKRLHPSHVEGMIVNLKNVSEKDLFKAARRSSTLKDRKCHWEKNRKVRVLQNAKKSPPLPKYSKALEGKRGKKPPLNSVVKNSVKTEAASVEWQGTAPFTCHFQLSNNNSIVGNYDQSTIQQLKRCPIVRLERLENM